MNTLDTVPITDIHNGIRYSRDNNPDNLHAINGIKIEVLANVDGKQRYVEVDSDIVATMIWNQIIVPYENNKKG